MSLTTSAVGYLSDSWASCQFMRLVVKIGLCAT